MWRSGECSFGECGVVVSVGWGGSECGEVVSVVASVVVVVSAVVVSVVWWW